jgi:glutamate/tyrosine decarboxylase-like PLP-dependent enzyme
MSTDRSMPLSPAYEEAISHIQPEFDLKDVTGTTSLETWFLGPRAENQRLLESLIIKAVGAHCEDRRECYPHDPAYVTHDMRLTPDYRSSVATIGEEFETLLEQLKSSVPFFSYRYQAHMNWDQTIPAIAGYLAGMMYNQNNVAVEAAPVTTLIEIAVGESLCRMLGYPIDSYLDDGSPEPWGHITCDGTVANIEALWSARNLKYYAITVKETILAHSDRFPKAADELEVDLPTGGSEKLCSSKLTTWQLLNLRIDTVLALPKRLKDYAVDGEQDLALLNNYSLQFLGYEKFRRQYLDDDIGDPAVLVTATRHYSWPKAAALLGIGQGNLAPIAVDLDARASEQSLRESLEQCLEDKRPVIANIAVIGSTELSAVDPLDRMLALRKEFSTRGVTYPIHADAAWGGYFAAIKRPRPKGITEGFQVRLTPEMVMSEYVNRQYDCLHQADSISIDPHKAGFVPYPAGALCYRNSHQKNLVSFTAPYVDTGGVGGSIGFYGVEGSKPGAAAVGVYMSHRIIPPDQRGYGRILGQALFNSKRLSAEVVTMADNGDPFIVVPVQRLPSERPGPINEDTSESDLDKIRRLILGKTNEQLRDCKEAMKLLAELGSDQIIIGYMFNYLVNGKPQNDLALVNKFNKLIAEKLSLMPHIAASKTGPTSTELPPLILSSSQFDPQFYDQKYLQRLFTKLGITKNTTNTALTYLISCTMDPWLTDTDSPEGKDRNFIPILIDILRKTVHEAIPVMAGANGS